VREKKNEGKSRRERRALGDSGDKQQIQPPKKEPEDLERRG
jgi:hypothetical protein